MFFHRVGGLANDIPEGEYVVTNDVLLYNFICKVLKRCKTLHLYFCSDYCFIWSFDSNQLTSFRSSIVSMCSDVYTSK